MLTQTPEHTGIMTIERHILEEQSSFPEATGVLTNLLYDIALAGKVIASQTTRGGLAEILGKSGSTNIQGEEVMKLDELADRMVSRLNDHTGRLAVMASEEQEDIIPISPKYPIGSMSCCMIPWMAHPTSTTTSALVLFSLSTVAKPRAGPGTMEDCLQIGVIWSSRGT